MKKSVLFQHMKMAIESMRNREAKDKITRAKEYGFVWGLWWISHHWFKNKEIIDLAKDIMNKIDEDLEIGKGMDEK